MGFFDRFRTKSSPPPAFHGLPTAPEPSTPMLDFLFNSMGIDEEWSVRTDDAFTWWGHELAQSVWVSKPVVTRGIEAAQVIISIDVAKGDLSEKVRGAINATNMMASLSGLAVDASGRVTLNCSTVLFEGNRPWLRRLLALAMGLQQSEAERISRALRVAGLEPLRTPHPQNGFRPTADPVLGAAHQFVSEHANRPLPGPHVFETVAFQLSRSGKAMAAAKEGQLVAQFPFGSTASLLTAEPTKHPTLGPGILFLLSLPLPALGDRDRGTSAGRHPEQEDSSKGAGSAFLALVGRLVC